MRTEDNIYWSMSLPKEHAALKELDAFCEEWGNLTRAEATRRILIEWEKVRNGKGTAAWGPQATASLLPSEERQRPGGGQKPVFLHSNAKAASKVLDD